MQKKMIKKRIILFGIIVAVTFVIAITAGLHAKYIRKVSLQGSVEFSSELAEKVELNESEAVPTKSGRYKLNQNKKVLENNYKVMPGVNIPKDPAITVTGKTGIPSYLFVEVTETDIPDTVTYLLCECWEKINNTNNIYVYTGDDFDAPIKILKDDILNVSAQYNGESFNLNFTAYLYQKLNNETAEETYSRVTSES